MAIFDLAIAFGLAFLLSILAKLLKQPLILAYLTTGAIISYFGFFDLVSRDIFTVFADLGIMFLLFLVGLEINYSSLKIVGKTSIIIGLGQIIFTSIIGYFIAQALGFNSLTSAYIAVALTFSSTIIIVKLLSDKRDLNSLYGKISIGLMLVQDLVAILILIALSGASGSTGSWLNLYVTIIKGVVLFAATFWLSKKVLPKIFDLIAYSQELLFLASTAWMLLMTVVVTKLGFSIEIAGFLAGLALANSLEAFQIAGKIKPLRDFFILLFFVTLGSSFVVDFSQIGVPVLIFSLFVLIGNPFIVLVLMGLLGYRKRTSFLTGVTVAQISEFSLILAAMGFRLGHIDSQTVSLITAVGIITITSSTYLIVYGNHIYKALAGLLTVFEKQKTKEEHSFDPKLKKQIVLVGFHRTGSSLAEKIPKQDLVVIEFDPETIKKLKARDYDYLFGDINDPDIFEKAVSSKTRLIISTSPDFEDNLSLIARIKQIKRRPQILVRSETEKETKALYEKGADYVILPHFISGRHMGQVIAANPSSKAFKQMKAKDLAILKKD